MKYSSLAVMCLVVATSAAGASAQQYEFRGQIEAGVPSCYYCPPGNSVQLTISHTGLTSSTYAMASYLGMDVIGAGIWNGSSTSPSIEVTSLQVIAAPAVPEFGVSGSGHPGSHLNFSVTGTQGDGAVIGGCLTPGFLAVDGVGLLFLDLPTMFILGEGAIGNNGQFKVVVDIPNLPSLAGINAIGQALVFPSIGSPYLTNADNKILG